MAAVQSRRMDSLLIEESMDVAFCSQLSVHVRYSDIEVMKR